MRKVFHFGNVVAGLIDFPLENRSTAMHFADSLWIRGPYSYVHVAFQMTDSLTMTRWLKGLSEHKRPFDFSSMMLSS